MDPPSPVSELDRRNVTLFCDVASGNPASLYSVKWYMDGNLLKQLPLCEPQPDGSNGDLCDIDPSKLLLEHVSKLFHGNFSCEGANEAGWGEPSEEQQLEIYCKYNSLLSFNPDLVQYFMAESSKFHARTASVSCIYVVSTLHPTSILSGGRHRSSSLASHRAYFVMHNKKDCLS